MKIKVLKYSLKYLTPSTMFCVIYLFDKGYAHYQLWKEWTRPGAFYVTRLNENACYEVSEGKDESREQVCRWRNY